MSEREVFTTPCYNFVGGDRQIEGILRDLPPRAGLVVRNRASHVVATAGGLADIARGRTGAPWLVQAPDNAMDGAGLADVYPGAMFYRVAAERLYGLRVMSPAGVGAPAAGGGIKNSLLIACGYTTAHEAAAARLAAWIANQDALPVVLLAPPGEPLARALRPLAARPIWSAQRWDGLNAFSRPTVEEAVGEWDPAHVIVAAASPATALHTAIGALDWGIRRAAARGEGADLRQAGARVTMWEDPDAPGALAQVAPASLRVLLQHHLTAELGVASVASDPRFRATSEGIAIDLV